MKKLYTLVDKCARVEEGRKLPGEEDCIDIDSKDDDKSTSQRKKNRKRNKKHKDKAVMIVEGLGTPKHLLLPLELPRGTRPARPLLARPHVPTPASAPLRSAALPLRTCQRAPPARARIPRQHHLRPRRCPSRRTARAGLLLEAPPLTANRKARSSPSCGRMSTCLHGKHPTSPAFPGR